MRLKRTLSLIMAVVIVAVAIPTSVLVSAADTVSVMFKNSVTGKLEQTTTLLEGETIRIETNKPDNYNYQKNPFSIPGKTPAEVTQIFSGTNESIKANLMSSYTSNDLETYDITPSFNAIVSQSTVGSAVYSDADGKTVQLFVSATSIGKQIPVSERSTLTFKTSAAQANLDEAPVFDKVTSATGSLVDFLNAGIGAYIDDNGRLIVQLFKDGTGGDGKVADLTLDVKIAGQKNIFPAGTTFTITFSFSEANPMQLTIISRQRAVNNIADQIGQDVYFEKYVKLKGTDAQHTITQKSFDLVHMYQDYNHGTTPGTGFYIDWQWVPDNPSNPDGTDNQSVVKIVKTNDNAQTWLASVTQPLDNVTGKLIARVYFNKHGPNELASTTSSSINITIIGTGTQPYFEPIETHIGYYDTATGQQKFQIHPITDAQVPDKLDVYDGGKKDWVMDPPIPYEFTGNLHFGTGQGAAKYIQVQNEFNGNARGEVEIYLDNSTSKYAQGTNINNPSQDNTEAQVYMKIKAVQAGSVKLKFTYYNAKGDVFLTRYYSIFISNASPSPDDTLRDLKVVGIPEEEDPEKKEHYEEVYPGGIIPFGFTRDKTDYAFTVPNIVKEVNVTPFYNYFVASHSDISRPITMKWIDENGEQVTSMLSDTSPNPTNDYSNDIMIPLKEGDVQKITLQGLAEDGSTSVVYSLAITRDTKNNNYDLKSLSFITTEDKKEWITDFDPIKYYYEVSLSYAYRGDGKAQITAETDDMWAKKPTIACDREGIIYQTIIDKLFNTGSAKMNLVYTKGDETGEANVFEIKVTATSESGRTMDYIIEVTIEDPNENNQLSTLAVYTSAAGQPLAFDNGQTFNKDGRDFYLTIPYSTENLIFELLPEDEKAQKVRITHPDEYIPMFTNNPEEKPYRKKATPVQFNVKVPVSDPIKPTQKDFDYKFEAQAENDVWTGEDTTPYVLHIARADPNLDSRLSSITVVNADDNVAVPEFAFNQLKTEYNFNVPFNVSQVIVSPVPQYHLSTVTVDGKKITDTYTGKTVVLNSGVVTTVTIEVVPEGGKQYATTYVLNITRETPSNEARLISLVVNGGENFTPEPFVPSRTFYSVEIPEGTRNYTLSPTPLDPNATITVDGVACPNGGPSLPIVASQADYKIEIIVTAQDGTTQKKYQLSIRDYNFVKKSSNANLDSLDVYYADISPSFEPNRDEYELYLKPNAMAVELIPHTSSSRAKAEVFMGSKKLSKYDGKYSASILEDKQEFTIKVTAEDGTENTYTLYGYRNDKKKQGAFKPITSTMVDYEKENPIVIDITQYAVIDASVFNTLKTDYPDKTIQFKGNDYTFEIKGTDIKGLVPHTQTYDLYFSFTAPDEQLIIDKLYDLGVVEYDPIYFHFNNHGSLPGKMTLTVNMGREYANRQLYWNYFNEERERIDYYGYVNSNAKGTFKVPMTHFSTYLLTTSKLSKANEVLGGDISLPNQPADGGSEGSFVDGQNPANQTTGEAKENIDANETTGKHNAQTGVKAWQEKE